MGSCGKQLRLDLVPSRHVCQEEMDLDFLARDAATMPRWVFIRLFLRILFDGRLHGSDFVFYHA